MQGECYHLVGGEGGCSSITFTRYVPKFWANLLAPRSEYFLSTWCLDPGLTMRTPNCIRIEGWNMAFSLERLSNFLQNIRNNGVKLQIFNLCNV